MVKTVYKGALTQQDLHLLLVLKSSFAAYALHALEGITLH